MDLMESPEQRSLREAAADFLRGRAPGAARAGHDAKLWAEMVALGWPGLALPESDGGAGASLLGAAAVVEELGAALVPGPLPFTMASALGPVSRCATPDQRAKHLAAVVAGVVWTTCDAEASVRAVRTGGGYELSGTSMLVPHADIADSVLVVAAEPEGTTAFVLPAGTPGMRVSPQDTVGLAAMFRVDFDRVVTPGDFVLGTPGRGAAVRSELDAMGAALTCVEMVGGARRVLEMTVAHARERQQFGRPIGSFQSVQNHCADMAVDVLGARLTAYEAVWHLSAGESSTERSPTGDSTVGDSPVGDSAAVTVAVAKSWVNQAYERVCALAHQVHGAIGFTDEHDLHLYSRHAAETAVRFGDTAHQLNRVAAELGLSGSGTG